MNVLECNYLGGVAGSQGHDIAGHLSATCSFIPVPGLGVVFLVLGIPDAEEHEPESLVTGVYLPGIIDLVITYDHRIDL